MSGQNPRLARQHRAILAIVIVAAAGWLSGTSAAATREPPTTSPVVIAPAPKPAPSKAASSDRWTAGRVARTVLIVLAFALIGGALVVKRRAVRTALRNAPRGQGE